MNEQLLQLHLAWDELLKLAEENTKKGRKKIDAVLPLVSNNSEYIDSAYDALTGENEQAQALAASLFFVQPTELFQETVEDNRYPGLINRLEHNVTGSNRLEHNVTESKGSYAQFRAAFALYKHGYKTETVVEKVKKALGDDDVREIAKELLEE